MKGLPKWHCDGKGRQTFCMRVRSPPLPPLCGGLIARALASNFPCGADPRQRREGGGLPSDQWTVSIHSHLFKWKMNVVVRCGCKPAKKRRGDGRQSGLFRAKWHCLMFCKECSHPQGMGVRLTTLHWSFGCGLDPPPSRLTQRE